MTSKLGPRGTGCAEIEAAGYHVVFSGQKAYNGVAIISKTPPNGDAVTRLPGVEDGDRRVLCADYGDLRLINLYVPNGQAVGSDQYDYKLAWLQQLAHYLKNELKRHPKLVLMGDLNAVESSAAITTLVAEAGLVDAFRAKNPDAPGFTVWQPVTAPERRAFRRVDYVLMAPGRLFPGAVVDSRVVVDKPGRLPDGSPIWPSDHYGVLADLAVFPPAATTTTTRRD